MLLWLGQGPNSKHDFSRSNLGFEWDCPGVLAVPGTPCRAQGCSKQANTKPREAETSMWLH